MNARFFRVSFLTPAPFFAKAAEVSAETLADVHSRNEARLSLINLQTMSDISR